LSTLPIPFELQVILLWSVSNFRNRPVIPSVKPFATSKVPNRRKIPLKRQEDPSGRCCEVVITMIFYLLRQGRTRQLAFFMVLLMTLGMIPEGSGLTCHDCANCGDAEKLQPATPCGDATAKHCFKDTTNGVVTRGCWPGATAIVAKCQLEVIGSCAEGKPTDAQAKDIGICTAKAGVSALTGGFVRADMEKKPDSTCFCEGDACNSGWMMSSSMLLLTTATLIAGAATQSSWLGA